MKNIGIGTYAFGMSSSMSLFEKLQKAKEMGYTTVEFLANDLKNNSIDDLRDMLKKSGIECASLHASMDQISKLLPTMAKLGGKQIICPGHPFADEQEAIDCAKLLEEKGKEAAQYGIKIGYHNHRSEFFEVNGKPLHSIVIENSNPRYVFFQLDCGWASAAGINCPEYISKYSGRFCSVHVKENNKMIGIDKPRSAKDQQQRPPMQFGPDGKPIMTDEMKKMREGMREATKIQCPMGDPSSRIDWKAIKEATDAQGINCEWIVERENDYADDMLKCLADDCAWLTNNL